MKMNNTKKLKNQWIYLGDFYNLFLVFYQESVLDFTEFIKYQENQILKYYKYKDITFVVSNIYSKEDLQEFNILQYKIGEVKDKIDDILQAIVSPYFSNGRKRALNKNTQMLKKLNNQSQFRTLNQEQKNAKIKHMLKFSQSTKTYKYNFGSQTSIALQNFTQSLTNVTIVDNSLKQKQQSQWQIEQDIDQFPFYQDQKLPIVNTNLDKNQNTKVRNIPFFNTHFIT